MWFPLGSKRKLVRSPRVRLSASHHGLPSEVIHSSVWFEFIMGVSYFPSPGPVVGFVTSMRRFGDITVRRSMLLDTVYQSSRLLGEKILKPSGQLLSSKDLSCHTSFRAMLETRTIERENTASFSSRHTSKVPIDGA